MLLDLLLVLLCHWNYAVGDVVKVCVIFRVGMIADHQRNLASEFASALPVEQIYKAVVILGDKNGYARTVVRGGDAPLNRKLFGDGREPLWKILEVELETGKIPFKTREVSAFDAGPVLLEGENVAAMPVDEIRDCGIEAFPIRTA